MAGSQYLKDFSSQRAYLSSSSIETAIIRTRTNLISAIRMARIGNRENRICHG
jgi:hypothetical protein